MNPIAQSLNKEIEELSPTTYALLSNLGKRLFFPKGILSQSAEAKSLAKKYNATIGTAILNGRPMHLKATEKFFNLEAEDVYPYAPPAGRPALRQSWKKKVERENPSTQNKDFGLPIVTSAITHGLSLVGELFIDEGDVIISPNKLWGNYRLTYETRLGAKIETFELFNEQDEFNVEALSACMKEQAAKTGKLVIILNFPNNPTGYTPKEAEAEGIVAAIKAQAEAGTKILTVSDDSYFGLFYEDSITESLFGRFIGLHENLLPLKLDGATKEYYAWGFRTGFITFGAPKGVDPKIFTALEEKTKGSIRGAISNCCHTSQTVVEKVLADPDFPADAADKHNIMKSRALKVKEVLNQAPYQDELKYYPFNSGYFLCLKFADLDVELLRMHLLEKYGVGTIAIGKTDLRIAFSCIEAADVPELFELILAGVRDLRAA
ncbi:MAG: aminotransferase class I/II-fold pyridoxal phosphate-dependent enzyme [SAR324 cluster bacterium]|nr:aminotransferase class I/II-fold pyridoxal phosphate-dependent enzyme [SAR324 cluster bacterium]